MATQETVNIIDLDIDQGELIKKLTQLQGKIKDLKDDTKSLQEVNEILAASRQKDTAQYKDNAAQIEKNKAETKSLSGEYRQHQNTLSALTASEKGQLGTLQQLAVRNKDLRNEVKTLDLSQKEGRKRLQEINKELDKNNKFIKENADSTLKQKINIGNYQSALQGLPGPLAKIVTGFQAMTKAAWAFIATPIGAVIAAVVAAIALLTSYFRRSEEGQNAFIKITKTLGSVLDNLMDIISNLGKALYNAVTKPKEAWDNFKKFVQDTGEFFKNTFGKSIGGSIDIFTGTLEKGFAKAGIAWQRFKGLFTDNAEAIAKAQEKVAEADEKIAEGQKKLFESGAYQAMYWDKVRGKVKDYYGEIISDAEIAKRLADEEANLRKQERSDIVENARLRSESAALRAEAEQQKLVDAQKSIELYNQSFDIDEKILANELAIAERKAENARISASLAKSDIETLDKIAQLEADVENRRAAFDEKRRERTRRLNMIRTEAHRQETDRLKAELETEKINADENIRANERILKDERSTFDERLKAFNENTDKRTELLKSESDIELQEIQSRYDLQLINFDDFQIQKQLIELRYADKARQLIEQQVQFAIDLENLRVEKTLEIQQLNFENENAGLEYQFEYKLQILEMGREAELLSAEKTGADKLAIERKYAQLRIDLEDDVQRAKWKVLSDFSGAISQLFGQNTIAAKIAAIAQATINTYLGATAAFAQTPGGILIKSLAAAAAVAQGIASVMKIRSVSTGGATAGPTQISSPQVGIGSKFASNAPQYQVSTSEGGITIKTLINDTAAAVKQGVKEALQESPPQSILVVDQVTEKQQGMSSIEKTATV